MHLVNQIGWVEQVGLSGARRGTSNIDAPYGPLGCQDHGATRQLLARSEMTNVQAWYVSNAALMWVGPFT